MKQELGPLQKKWMEALRAHPERQMSGRLGKQHCNGEYKACCLGEGGIVAGVCTWTSAGVLQVSDGPWAHLQLTGQAHKALGLRSDVGSAVTPFSVPSLADLNDEMGKTWPEIADIIESDPSVYFTHPV